MKYLLILQTFSQKRNKMSKTTKKRWMDTITLVTNLLIIFKILGDKL